jgi:hypothetical protein
LVLHGRLRGDGAECPRRGRLRCEYTVVISGGWLMPRSRAGRCSCGCRCAGSSATTRSARRGRSPSNPVALTAPRARHTLLRREALTAIAVALAGRAGARLEDRLEHDLHRGLHDPIPNRRDRQRPALPRTGRLRDKHPPRRQRPVGPAAQVRGQLVEQPGNPVLLNIGQGDLVDARRAVIAAHRDPRPPQDIPAQDLVPAAGEAPVQPLPAPAAASPARLGRTATPTAAVQAAGGRGGGRRTPCPTPSGRRCWRCCAGAGSSIRRPGRCGPRCWARVSTCAAVHHVPAAARPW